MAKRKTNKYTIELVKPKGVTQGEMLSHISEAVTCWGGQLHPEHPLFNIGMVRVKTHRSPNLYPKRKI